MENNIQYIFSEDGPIKCLKPDYIPRPSQVEGAQNIYEALDSNKHIILEGPTGYGKTLAYLIPTYQNIIDSEFSKVAVIVTAGISLQEQLYYKDAPLVKQIMRLNNPESDFKIALLKGKQNFICVNKMRDIIADNFTEKTSVSNLNEFEKIKNWYFETKSGDFSELDFVPSPETAKDVSCVSEGECLGRNCPNYGDCFYYRHKAKVNSSNIIITNYHMLFSDLKIGGKILPKFDIMIFDEAHEIANIFRDYMTISATQGVINKIRNDFSEIFNKDEQMQIHHQDNFDAKRFIGISTDFFENLEKTMFSKFDNIVLLEEKEIPNVTYLIDELKRVLGIAYEINETVSQQVMIMIQEDIPPDDEEFVNKQRVENKSSSIIEKLSELIFMLSNYKEIANSENDIVWTEKDTKKVSVSHKPLMVGEELYKNFWSREGLSCIITSATLSVNENFEYIKEQMGLNLLSKDKIMEFIGTSPFDLTKQQLWYLPSDIPDGNTKMFDEMLPRNVENIIRACGGGVLCLFTSVRNMNYVYDNLRWEFPNLKLLKQGDKPKTQLINDFKEDENSVLFATKSFFTGIDVPGAALRCVIIDKFPFATPNDPVQQKLRNRPNAFYKYSIPEMIITLKQAVGRGVRSIDDTCVICILDGRMATAKYKGRINNSFNYTKTGTRKIEDVMKFCGVESIEKPNPYAAAFAWDSNYDPDEIPF